MTHPTQIAAQDYKTTWSGSARRIFTGGDPVDGSFRERDWKVVLLQGGLALEDVDFDALVDAASYSGDSTFVAAPYAEFGEREPQFLLGWKRPDLEHVRTESLLGHVDTIMFGQSARWGVLASPENFAVLGGTSQWMERFLLVAGGTQMVEDRFRRAAQEDVIGFGSQGRQYVDALLRAVNWKPLERSSSSAS